MAKALYFYDTQNDNLMEQHIFGFPLIVEGAAERVLQIKMPLKS
jgi:hypothetical protein